MMGVEAIRHNPRDEARLVRAAQQGDRPAFAALVEAYWERLFRWLYQLTRDRHLAEDLAQEAFLKAFANLDRFEAGTNFRAWLFRIAHNAFANQHRAAKSRHPLPDDLPAADLGPVDEALSREALRGLADAIDDLPTDFRSALLLRVEEDLSFREIAADSGSDGGDGPLARVQGPAETVGTAAGRRRRGMNCTLARRQLLQSDRPDHPAGAVAGHLDTCAACRAVQRHLVRLERNIPRLPVPASAPPAALLERVLNAPALVSRPVHLSPPRDPKSMARQKLALSLALAASLAVFALGWWAWPHRDAPSPSPVANAYQTKLAAVLEAAEGPEQRAEGLAGLAEKWFAGVELSDAKKMGELAQEFHWLMRRDLPLHAAQVSPGERARVLSSIVTRLKKLESGIELLAAARVPLGGPAASSLVRIRTAVRDAHNKLQLMASERA